MKTPYERKIEREDFWIEVIIFSAIAILIGTILA